MKRGNNQACALWRATRRSNQSKYRLFTQRNQESFPYGVGGLSRLNVLLRVDLLDIIILAVAAVSHDGQTDSKTPPTKTPPTPAPVLGS